MKWRVLPITAFASHSAAWDAINREGARLPFLDSRFIAAALRHFPAHDAVLAVGSQHGREVAMGVFTPAGRFKWDTWQPSQLPLGAWVMREGTDFADGMPQLAGALPGLPLAVGLSQIDPDIHPRQADNGRLKTLDYVPTSRVRIAGRFEDYWAGRGKNLRHNIKRQQARLAAQGLRTRLECLTDADCVATAIAQYGELEAASWKATLGTALRTDNTQGRFYRDVLESFAASAQMRIYRYAFDDTVVAMDLCLTMNDVLVILKTACKDDLQGLSPAVLMHREIFASLFDEGRLARVEFFGRVMEWHTRWTDETRMLYHANFYRTAWLPRLRAWSRAIGFGAAQPA